MPMQITKFPSANRTAIQLLAVSLVVVFAASAVSAATLQGKLVSRPLSRDDITLYKLPATTELTGGLSTIGVGQPVYLDAEVDIAVPASQIADVSFTLSSKPDGSAAVLGDSPLGKDAAIYEPSDRIILQVAGRALLRPDVPGRYTVTAVVTTVSAGSATLSLTVTAGTYMGISACSLCHKGGPPSTPWSMVNSWSETLHSSIFTNNINGVNGSSYTASCFGCHTVGYDTNPAAVNGGFDDIATKLGWTPPAVAKDGNFAAVPAALKNLANIQCENCHGPGSQHIASGGDPRLISVSTDSGVCGQCHGAATHHVKSSEWGNSLHAVTTRDAAGAGRESCVGCHTSNGFVARIQGTTPPDTTYNPINCQACHEPHGETTPSANAHLVRTLNSVTLKDGTTVTNAGMGTLCMNCHQSRQTAATYAATTPGSSHFGPHHGPQADMLEGVNGFTYDKTIPSSAHADMVENTCVACHMQTVDAADPALGLVGGHTFKPGFSGNATIPAKDLVAVCQTCHGPDVTSFNFPLMDYDGDGVIEGVQTEVQHLLDQLAVLLPPVGQAKSDISIDATWTQPQLEAAYNYEFVKSDGSLGIHNTAYAVGLLKASINNLTKK